MCNTSAPSSPEEHYTFNWHGKLAEKVENTPILSTYHKEWWILTYAEAGANRKHGATLCLGAYYCGKLKGLGWLKVGYNHEGYLYTHREPVPG